MYGLEPFSYVPTRTIPISQPGGITRTCGEFAEESGDALILSIVPTQSNTLKGPYWIATARKRPSMVELSSAENWEEGEKVQ